LPRRLREICSGSSGKFDVHLITGGWSHREPARVGLLTSSLFSVHRFSLAETWAIRGFRYLAR
jgi:hypothetical protein